MICAVCSIFTRRTRQVRHGGEKEQDETYTLAERGQDRDICGRSQLNREREILYTRATARDVRPWSDQDCVPIYCKCVCERERVRRRQSVSLEVLRV